MFVDEPRYRCRWRWSFRSRLGRQGFPRSAIPSLRPGDRAGGDPPVRRDPLDVRHRREGHLPPRTSRTPHQRSRERIPARLHGPRDPRPVRVRRRQQPCRTRRVLLRAEPDDQGWVHLLPVQRRVDYERAPPPAGWLHPAGAVTDDQGCPCGSTEPYSACHGATIPAEGPGRPRRPGTIQRTGVMCCAGAGGMNRKQTMGLQAPRGRCGHDGAVSARSRADAGHAPSPGARPGSAALRPPCPRGPWRARAGCRLCEAVSSSRGGAHIPRTYLRCTWPSARW